MFRWHVVSAVMFRNLKQYFTSVLGYLFIVGFVTTCALLAFRREFFADNLANLDQLSEFFPFLLLFLVPAITMGVWADEKKQGTDAILFTLPASDFEILIGKFLSVVFVYTIALFFSGVLPFALSRIGNPDWGVIATTYMGYWLAGVALCAVGMFASSLTGSTTVAFVLGAILCSIPVFIGYVFEGNRMVEAYGVGPQMRDFALGQISLPGVIYFASITVFMLYLNLVVISRRHWSRGKQYTLAGHFMIRVMALGVGLISLNVLAENSTALFNNRIDLTSEQLYTLDQSTRQTLANAAEKNRPVTIQAFLSSNVPRDLVSTRKHMIGLLRQYDRLGGNNVDVRFVDVKPNSDQIEEARSLGIEPQSTRDEIAGRVIEQEVFMGAVVTSTLDEVTLPFIDGDTAIEYELTRSLATATDDAKRLKLGILETDAHFNNLEVAGNVYDWIAPLTIQALDKQYDLIDINADQLAGFMPGGSAAPGVEKPDVLVVVDPSSLTMSGMFNLVSYIEAGNPTLILADPLPFYWFTYQAPRQLGVVNAPAQPRIGAQAPWREVAISAEPKAFNGQPMSLMQTLGIQWPHDRVVWNLDDPHVGFKPELPQRFGERWPDYYGPRNNLFVFARSHAGHQAFNTNSQISKGLHEVMFFYPGSIQTAQDAKTEFQPLITLKPGAAGHYQWDEFTQEIVSTRQEFDRFTGQVQEVTGPEENPYTGQPLRVVSKSPRLSNSRTQTPSGGTNGNDASDETRSKLDQFAHVLAAHIKGKDDSPLNVVYIADTDFISDMYFQQQAALGEPLDNFIFFVNAIETLAGDTSFVRLRNRRPTPRTLVAIENMTEKFRIDAARQQEKIEKEINQQLDEAQAAVDAATKEISADEEMSVIEKIQQSVFSAQNEERNFLKRKEKLEKELAKETANIKAREQREINRVERWVWMSSILLAALPGIVLGLAVFFYRRRSEQSHIDPRRKV